MHMKRSQKLRQERRNYEFEHGRVKRTLFSFSVLSPIDEASSSCYLRTIRLSNQCNWKAFRQDYEKQNEKNSNELIVTVDSSSGLVRFGSRLERAGLAVAGTAPLRTMKFQL